MELSPERIVKLWFRLLDEIGVDNYVDYGDYISEISMRWGRSIDEWTMHTWIDVLNRFHERRDQLKCDPKYVCVRGRNWELIVLTASRLRRCRAFGKDHEPYLEAEKFLDQLSDMRASG